jgi:hypothetical protein
MQDLPIIQKTYDLIKWYVPILDRLPRKHKFALGDRMIAGLYDLLEGLILARYAQEKLAQLELLNAKLDILRHQGYFVLDRNSPELKFRANSVHSVKTDYNLFSVVLRRMSAIRLRGCL